MIGDDIGELGWERARRGEQEREREMPVGEVKRWWGGEVVTVN